MFVWWIVMTVVVFCLMMIGYFGFEHVPVFMMHIFPPWGMYVLFIQIERMVKRKDIIERAMCVFMMFFIGVLTFQFCGHLDTWYKTGSLPQTWIGGTTVTEAAGAMLKWTLLTIIAAAMLVWVLTKLRDYLDKRKEVKGRAKLIASSLPPWVL